MQEPAPRRDVRLSVEMAERVDRWRGVQPGVPSRTKAVAALLDAALTVLGKEAPAPKSQAAVEHELAERERGGKGDGE